MLTRVRESRPHEAAAYAALKTATRLAAELAGPTLADVCRRTRLDAATLSRAGNTEHANFVPVDVALDIDKLSGDHPILRTMAKLSGFDLVPLVPNQEAHDLAVRIGHAAREVGEMASVALEAMSDGKVTPREAKEVLSEADDVERIVSSIKRHMHGVVAGANK